MDNKEMFNQIICDVLNIQPGSFSFEDDTETLGINSITFIKLVVEIENKFGIQFEDDMLNYEYYKNLNDVYQHIERLLEQKGSLSM